MYPLSRPKSWTDSLPQGRAASSVPGLGALYVCESCPLPRVWGSSGLQLRPVDPPLQHRCKPLRWHHLFWLLPCTTSQGPLWRRVTGAGLGGPQPVDTGPARNSARVLSASLRVPHARPAARALGACHRCSEGSQSRGDLMSFRETVPPATRGDCPGGTEVPSLCLACPAHP